MSKTTPRIPLPFIKIQKGNTAPMYLQLYEQIKAAIFSARLKEGERMPSTRHLATDLDISRNSVFQAYEQLILEGYLAGKKGDGTYVSAKLNPISASTRKTMPVKYNDVALPDEVLRKDSTVEPVMPFQNSVPSIHQFPFKIWSGLAAEVYREVHSLHLGYGETLGHLPLREALVDYLRINRSIICEADQILIVNGSRQALNLAAQALIRKGDLCWMEDPGYLGARAAMTRWGGKVCPIPITENGLDIAYAMKHYPEARFVYLTPSHQYPLGATMPLSERLKLLKWAARHKMWIVEDDYDSEFRYNGRPVPALKGLDDHGNVIYTGTFSKVLFPALRIGYMVLPSAAIAQQFKMVKSTIDRQSPVIDQAIVTQFMLKGHFARHLRKMRTLYKKQQEELVALLEKHLSKYILVAPADTGMHFIAWLKRPCNMKKLITAALAEGVILIPVNEFAMKFKQEDGFIFGFTGYGVPEMEKAVLVLKKLLERN
ncbi:aminotransferase class I/II-fold pyridoxal phosphate-dependent enzyme [Chitinophaga sp. SYP-B3965]|uniref:MocR-like pyridoxine biosynthesis transcription factor PdxR n=1 Tax=Chitinophaga sp. SYP-B3965 TaxID=2663120 RepID=UPI001299C26E|nr:PLP-dependent aminotransferase family protein [Chitinophaga sp. SYP-B3965]MRG43491.1 aminotransferase class I/II-fold pyridoxal phosphate-dependent enzyme [Chitinophaga sp. SYP-B3965]